jgi:flavin reductase (DIM6/NTAB) family NADH-FMN oxidoreductase RutF
MLLAPMDNVNNPLLADDNAASFVTTTKPTGSTTGGWLELTEGKQWSRLLYTNPVCFLCTTSNNVMVLSWLTASNNHGHFLFSMNKRRFTASILLQDENKHFVLCVPVRGMEDLVRNVGSVSGQFSSKFPDQHHPEDVYSSNATSEPPLSKRQRKKMPRFPAGVPGLKTVSIGTDSTPHSSTDDDALFAIHGTVAHMVCRLDRLLEGITDDEHFLGVAQVTCAHVRTDYWNATKNLFQPKCSSVPPYLTFFGAQTFGHVVAATDTAGKNTTAEDKEQRTMPA